MKVIKAGNGKYQLTATAQKLGEDFLVAITGGTRAHIGACAMAQPRPSLLNDGSVSATASVLCNPAHKDDMPAREAALTLSSRLNTTVCVTCGIHIDNATREDLEGFMQAFHELLDKLITELQKDRP